MFILQRVHAFPFAIERITVSKRPFRSWGVTAKNWPFCTFYITFSYKMISFPKAFKTKKIKHPGGNPVKKLRFVACNSGETTQKIRHQEIRGVGTACHGNFTTWESIESMWGFPKMVGFPQQPWVFPTKTWSFWGVLEVASFRKPPCVDNSKPNKNEWIPVAHMSLGQRKFAGIEFWRVS